MRDEMREMRDEMREMRERREREMPFMQEPRREPPELRRDPRPEPRRENANSGDLPGWVFVISWILIILFGAYVYSRWQSYPPEQQQPAPQQRRRIQ
jgi:hypothetical protein